MTSRKQRAMETRQLVLETASRLTGERGFEAVTIQDICTEAGVSVGTFYHYFDSKDQIILAWYGLSDEYFVETIVPKLREIQEDVFRKVQIFAREQVGFGMRCGIQNIRQLYRAQILHNSQDFYSFQRGLPKAMLALIREGQERKQLRGSVSAEQIAREVLSVIRGVILEWIWGGTRDPQTQAAEMASRYLEAYRV